MRKEKDNIASGALKLKMRLTKGGSRPPPPVDQLPFGFLRVACDEVTVHVEQTDPQQVEDDVQSVAQRHRLVVSLPEGSQRFLLRTRRAGGSLR